MFPRVLPLAGTVMLSVGAAAAHAAPAALDSLHLLDQADALPDDFRDYFFDVPVVVRVEVDGRYLGDARALLTRGNALALLAFVDTQGSDATGDERQRWLQVLAEPRALGPCATGCAQGLAGLHYSLENSLLSVATDRAGQADAAPRYHALPERGSHGMVLRHQVNAYAGDSLPLAGRYALDAQASVGRWTVQGHYQLDRSADREGELRHAAQSLYAQREFNDHFLRVGWFLPGFQGVTRQPRATGSLGFTTMGVMAGSSDTLLADSRAASLHPVYVTANREGSVEVYRDGSLILTQPVQPGLQQLDTRRLPGGIYAVELRVIEDGRETAREAAVIHKPSQWRDPSRRWRYSAFAGQQRSLLDSVDDPQAGKAAVGGVINYLAHARAVLGLAAQQIGDARAVAGSLDWQLNDRANLLTNAYRSRVDGHGVDLQGLLRYRTGSVTLSHNRSWLPRRRWDDDRFVVLAAGEGSRWGGLQVSAVGVNHRIGDRSHLAARVSQQRGISSGRGLDVSFSRRQLLFGADAHWRATVFDRPASAATGLRRNRGVDLTLNIALGREGRRYSGSLGSRTGTRGGRDLYAGVGVQQGFDDGWVRGLAGQATVDREGVGVSGNAQFEHPALRGDAYVQRSPLGGTPSGGINLESTLAVGGGTLSVSGAGQLATTQTGMIVDVDSDLPDVVLRAHDRHGGSYPLHPGATCCRSRPTSAGCCSSTSTAAPRRPPRCSRRRCRITSTRAGWPMAGWPWSAR